MPHALGKRIHRLSMFLKNQEGEYHNDLNIITSELAKRSKFIVPHTKQLITYYESDGDPGRRTHYIVGHSDECHGSSPRFENKRVAKKMETEFHARGSRLTRKDFHLTMQALANELNVRTY